MAAQINRSGEMLQVMCVVLQGLAKQAATGATIRADRALDKIAR